MLLGLSLFVSLEWARFAPWLVALAGRGARASPPSGTTIGALAREVSTASLLAFTLLLPVAFLALVPSGVVSLGALRPDARDLGSVPVQGDGQRDELGALRQRRRSGSRSPHLVALAVAWVARVRRRFGAPRPGFA